VAIFEVDGTRIAYDRHGDGAPNHTVVLLHAFPLSRLMWEPQIEELSGVWQFIVPYMRGHGASDVASEATTMERMADDVHALVESLEVGPIVLVGLSMGGYVALAYMRKYAAEVEGLVLADTRATPDTEEARAGRYALIEEVAATGPQVVAERMLPRLLAPKSIEEKPELVVSVRRMIETTSAAGIGASLAGIAERPDSTDLLASIAVPTLVVVGANDEVTPESDARAMADAIPGAQLEVIDDVAHLSNLEAPVEFNRVLKAFLSNLNGTTE
jgi:pimeloyl-ACP methyl ester carboxylesterase